MLHTLIHFTRSGSSNVERFSHLKVFTQIAEHDLSNQVVVTKYEETRSKFSPSSDKAPGTNMSGGEYFGKDLASQMLI
jgi:hypothetical protein